MRRIVPATAAILFQLVAPHITKADLAYTIQNYPAYQNGTTLEGTITTNGQLGYDVRVTGSLLEIVAPSGTVVENGDPSTIVQVGLFATADELLMASSAPIGDGRLVIEMPHGYLIWDRYIPETPSEDSYILATGVPGVGWNDFAVGPLGGDPWVIGVVVPEPSTLIIAGLGAACGIAYVLARKWRAERKAATVS